MSAEPGENTRKTGACHPEAGEAGRGTAQAICSLPRNVTR